MAAHTWELDRDLALARWAKDVPRVQACEQALTKIQAQCAHVENPEVKGRCYKCGFAMGAG